MTGRIVHGREQTGDVKLEVDVVVCGSGAGGSMAARELARRGLEVLLLEEGGDHFAMSFTQREDEMLPRLFQQIGGQRTDDLAIPVLSGRGLGGSTVHNTNLIKRAPAPILAQWASELGVESAKAATLDPFYAEVERDLGVRPIPADKVNTANAVFRRGVEQLGWRGAIMSHNRDERCVGSGFCELGCFFDAKLNARRVLVPEAVAAGAVVYTDARVERISVERGRAVGATATLSAADGTERGRLTARSRAVCLAGSAIGSAALALRSELDDPHAQLGTGLRIHPASLVAGAFDERIDAWRGIPQSFECTEQFDPTPGSSKRVWLVPSFAHPAGTAAIMPGFGPALVRNMRSYPRMVVVAALVHDVTNGRVYLDGDRTRIAYQPDSSDRAQLALGARAAARILLAAGAREVTVPALPPIVVRTERDIARIDASRYLPHDGRVMSVHPMGTLRMGRDPTRSVVDSRGAHHQVSGLWVVDGSLFPTSIGGPPQLSIYAFAMQVARTLASELRS